MMVLTIRGVHVVQAQTCHGYDDDVEEEGPTLENDDDDLYRIQASIEEESLRPCQRLLEAPFDFRTAAWNSESKTSGGSSSIVRAFDHHKQISASQTDQRCGTLLADCMALEELTKLPVRDVGPRQKSTKVSVDITRRSYSHDLLIGSRVQLWIRFRIHHVLVNEETEYGFYFKRTDTGEDVFVENAQIESRVQVVRSGNRLRAPVDF